MESELQRDILCFIIVLNRKQLNFKEDSASDLRKGIVRYYMCAEILLTNDDSNNAKPLLRKIINKQDVRGRTPLYLAAKDWPKDVVQCLLRFGADISIPNYDDKYPLKRIK